MESKTISHYRILEKIGEGGMGVVYKARDLKLERFVALKFLPLLTDLTAEQVERFWREARAASALNHPNVGTIYEIDQANQRLFIAMEYIEGETLKQRIEREPLKSSEATNILIQVARGLLEAHRQGVIHRDIKPANIMIAKDGTVKILDFGLSWLEGSTRITGADKVVGTAAYMSPEQFSGEEADARTDIWSLGIVLYEMLTRKLPFKGEHPLALIYSIANEEPADISDQVKDVPEHLRNLYRHCLEKDKSKRVPTMSAVLQLLGEKTHPIKAGKYVRMYLKYPRLATTVGGIGILVVLSWFLITQDFTSHQSTGKKPKLGVFPFHDLTAQKSLGNMSLLIQMILVSNLTGVDAIGVVDPLSLNAALYKSDTTLRDYQGSELRRLAKGARIDYVIDGTMAQAGSSYLIQSRLLNAQNEEVCFISQKSLKSEDELAGVVASISREILDYFQIKLSQTGHSKDLAPWLYSRTQPIDAIKAFVLASQFKFRGISGSEKYLRRAIEIDSTFISPRIWLISGLVYENRSQEAEEQYQALLKQEASANPFEQAMIHWAGAYLDGDLRKQEGFLEMALQYSPGNNILLYNLSRTRYILEDYTGAIEALEPTIEMNWDYAPAHYLLGACYNMVQRYKLAKKVLLNSLHLRAVYPETYLILSTLSRREADTSKARKYEELYIQKSREQNLPLAKTYAYMASANLDEGFYGPAIKYYQSAVFLQPDTLTYHLGLAKAYAKLGKIGLAKFEYQRTLQLDSSLFGIYETLGMIYEEQGAGDSAKMFYLRYLKFDSLSAEAQSVKRRLSNLGQKHTN